MHQLLTYIYINMHTFATTTSQPKTTQPTSLSITKHAYYIINSTYNKLTTRTPTLDILGHHKSTPIFHYTYSHHLSFEEHLHYPVLKIQELLNSDHKFTSSFPQLLSWKPMHTHRENTSKERARKGRMIRWRISTILTQKSLRSGANSELEERRWECMCLLCFTVRKKEKGREVNWKGKRIRK